MLNSKQRSYLIGLSNSLTPVIMIGKSGVTPELVISAEEAFNTRELVKGSVQKSSLDDIRQSVNTLAERTRAEVVMVIGRKFVLYRPFKEDPVIRLPR